MAWKLETTDPTNINLFKFKIEVLEKCKKYVQT